MSRDPIMDAPSYSIRDFCLAENLSPASYFKMRKAGFGPRELRLPGSSIVRVTADARREWQQRMAKMNEENAAKLDAEREERAARQSKAGKRGAASPLHSCRRKVAKAG